MNSSPAVGYHRFTSHWGGARPGYCLETPPRLVAGYFLAAQAGTFVLAGLRSSLLPGRSAVHDFYRALSGPSPSRCATLVAAHVFTVLSFIFGRASRYRSLVPPHCSRCLARRRSERTSRRVFFEVIRFPAYRCYRRREMTRNRPSRKCANHGLDKGCSLATGPRRRRDIKEMVKKMPGSTQHLHTGRLRPFSERR